MSPELSCRELVELVTDYLEGAMTPAELARFEEHLAECEGCERYLEQMRGTVRAVGSLPAGELDPRSRAALLEAFRRFRTGDSRR